jgi:ribulose-5-phosphate 4-epimerase/fuculose-1-phosphate aldolase
MFFNKISRIPFKLLNKRFNTSGIPGNLPQPKVFTDPLDERKERKEKLAASFRLFSKLEFDEGVAGHITVRDPIYPDTFWVNGFGLDFSEINVSNLIRVDHEGKVVEGKYPVNAAAFSIHSRIHQSRPDVIAAAHSHSVYGKAFSTLGKLIDPYTQDACAFYNDHVLFSEYGGVAFELDEGKAIANALGPNKKAAILMNHGLLTVGSTVDECVWWYLSMEKCCKVELLIKNKSPNAIKNEAAIKQAYSIIGSKYAGWFQFQGIYRRIIKEYPDCLL